MAREKRERERLGGIVGEGLTESNVLAINRHTDKHTDK